MCGLTKECYRVLRESGQKFELHSLDSLEATINRMTIDQPEGWQEECKRLSRLIQRIISN